MINALLASTATHVMNRGSRRMTAPSWTAFTRTVWRAQAMLLEEIWTLRCSTQRWHMLARITANWFDVSTMGRSPNNRFERSRGCHLRRAEGGGDDLDNSASLVVGEAPRRSTSSLGVTRTVFACFTPNSSRSTK